MLWLVIILIVLVKSVFFSIADPGVEPDGWSCFVRVLFIVTSKFKRSILEIRGRILLIVGIPSSPLDFII